MCAKFCASFLRVAKILKKEGKTGAKGGPPPAANGWPGGPAAAGLSYDQLSYMKCRRISRAIKLLSRIFEIMKISKFFLTISNVSFFLCVGWFSLP